MKAFSSASIPIIRYFDVRHGFSNFPRDLQLAQCVDGKVAEKYLRSCGYDLLYDLRREPRGSQQADVSPLLQQFGQSFPEKPIARQ